MLLQYAGGKRFGPPVQLLICMMPIKPAVSKHKPASRRAHSSIFITMDITKYANDPLPKNKGDNAPYLDQISSGHLGSFRKTQQYKKLLIQPIQIPNLQHCGISSELVSTQTAENPYIAPDGKATQTLRNTIHNVLPAIRKSYLNYQAKKKEREATLAYEEHSVYGDDEYYADEGGLDEMRDQAEHPEQSIEDKSGELIKSAADFVAENQDTGYMGDDSLELQTEKKKKKKKKPRRSKKKAKVRIRVGDALLNNPKNYVL